MTATALTSFGLGIVQLSLDHQTEATDYNMYLNYKEEFISNIKEMLTSGMSNDIKIVLKDGQIIANKDVKVITLQQCLATTIEGETNIVNLDYCSKNIMEKIIKYLFSGGMNLFEMCFSDLVLMMNITRMMLLFYS